MKSTKAMYVGHGCLVQVTTQQRNPDGTYAVAEAGTFVPDVSIAEERDDVGNVRGRSLVYWATMAEQAREPASY
jgi:Lon protease-like protein